ncbi:type VII secretion-associated protein (TIGR03931 family) [Rhodococcus sp. LBL1]|nr:type VII secretion-associated protein (TIGR03931 family) [Rhodococcus sp. LBL1]MDH6683532.1 type VII secretion-associated protein (TIGR03931 family) [Rhodococcus sp. LBL2]
MVAAVVTAASLHLADGAVWVASPSGVVRVPDESIGHCLECIDDRYVVVGAQTVATVDVLAASLHRALETGTGGTGFAAAVAVTYPSHWGSFRRGVLESAVRRSAHAVSLVPVALAAPALEGCSRWVVLECAPLWTTASLVERGDRGEPAVVACELASDTGSLDLRDHPDRVAVLDRLVRTAAGERPVEIVLVTGSDTEIAGKLTAGIESRIVVVADTDLVRLPAPPPEGSQSGRDASPGTWLDHGLVAPPRRRSGRAVLAAVGVLVVAAVVGTALAFWQPWTRTGVSDVAEPLQRFEIGPVSVQLPDRWSAESKPGRLDLTPTGVGGRRIVLVPTDVAAGSDRAEVAHALERRIADRGPDGPFSEFDPDAEFAGRPGISYVESPDDRSRVRWHVLVEDGVQVSVGCQFRAGEWDALAADCEQAVRSVEVGAA